MPESQRKNRYNVTLSAAEWASLVICANVGAAEIEQQAAASSANRETSDQITLYCAQAVKIIHGVLPIRGGAIARGPSVNVSDDIQGEMPQEG